jgi:phosphatidylglycerol---prolipoprotein diacylglyceryl transferase
MQWRELGLSSDVFSWGWFTLRWYSLAYLAGIMLGYWHLTKMTKAPGAPLAQRHADDLFFYCTLGIIIGGRLGYAAFYTGGATGTPSIFTNFTPDETISWDLLRLWDGGMSFHGGLIGVLVAITWVSRGGSLSFLRVCDYISVCVPFGMLFGRLANFVNGELWGRVAESPVAWAMVFPGAGDLPRHPSQLYQAGLEGALLIPVMLWLFWRTRARWKPGLMVGTFTLGIALARFFTEFYREPDKQLADFAAQTGLSMGQWLTVPLMLVGAFFLVRALRRPELGSGSPAAA